MIILDSNQLRQAALPDGSLLTLLRKLSEANGHTLAIPQMVLDEHRANKSTIVTLSNQDNSPAARYLPICMLARSLA
jgi:hypothetical protein